MRILAGDIHQRNTSSISTYMNIRSQVHISTCKTEYKATILPSATVSIRFHVDRFLSSIKESSICSQLHTRHQILSHSNSCYATLRQYSTVTSDFNEYFTSYHDMIVLFYQEQNCSTTVNSLQPPTPLSLTFHSRKGKPRVYSKSYCIDQYYCFFEPASWHKQVFALSVYASIRSWVGDWYEKEPPERKGYLYMYFTGRNHGQDAETFGRISLYSANKGHHWLRKYKVQ